MSRNEFRNRLRALLEDDNFSALEAIWEDVKTKRKETVRVPVIERQVTGEGRGKRVVAERMVNQYVEIERYPIKDAITFITLVANFGVGKPPEEKTVNVNVTAKRLADATDAELDAIIEGTARELPTGS